MIGTRAKGPQSIVQDEHSMDACAHKVTSSILVPGAVVTGDITAAGVEVGKNKILRIRVAAATLIAFSDSSAIAAVDSSTSPALELPVAGTYVVFTTGKYIRGSAVAARMEVSE